jgi:hypothetical protein
MSDRAEFARLNSDVRVMEFMPTCLSNAESDLFLGRIEQHFLKQGFWGYMRLTCANRADLSEPWG